LRLMLRLDLVDRVALLAGQSYLPEITGNSAFRLAFRLHRRCVIFLRWLRGRGLLGSQGQAAHDEDDREARSKDYGTHESSHHHPLSHLIVMTGVSRSRDDCTILVYKSPEGC